MTEGKIQRSRAAAAHKLISHARERGLQSLPVASLVRLFGEMAPEIAQSVGLTLHDDKYMLPDMSFAEVVQRISTGETLPGIQPVKNEELHYTMTISEEPRIRKPWEVSPNN